VPTTHHHIASWPPLPSDERGVRPRFPEFWERTSLANQSVLNLTASLAQQAAAT